MKIAALISGGVDSSLALQVLKETGNHELTAFYLKIWLEDELAFLGDCPWEEDLHYARTVCTQLDVPLQIVSLQSEYREMIVEHTLRELRAGRTPSPDIFCNQWIKFGKFIDKIDPAYEKVATGHYARIVVRPDAFLLARSPDPIKDQTYFLSNLDQRQLGRALFPIGHLCKPQVRALAAQADLPTKERRDSQGICFLGKIQYRDFIRFHLGEYKGEIRDVTSTRTLGEHSGYWFYTIGQRFGLGLGGGPWYVTHKDIASNILYVAHGEQWEHRQQRQLTVTNLNWITGPPDNASLQVKLRHGPALAQCQILRYSETQAEVTLAEPDTGIAPGQHAVFYDGEICLGGGVID